MQKDLDRLGEWAAENEIKINPSKCKAFCLTRTWVKIPLNYTINSRSEQLQILRIILVMSTTW